MKKLYVTIILSLIVSNIFAQERLSIYKHSQGILYKSNQMKNWKYAERRTSLSQSDSIFIPKGGLISILDKFSSHTYPNHISNTDNICTVSQIIKNAMDDENKIILHVTQELFENSKVQSKQNKYVSLGVSSMSSSSIEHELASFILDHIKSNQYRNLAKQGLSLKSEMLDEYSCLKVVNTNKKGLYYNIIKIDENGIHICYNLNMVNNDNVSEISIFIGPNESSYLTNFSYTEFRNSDYFVIASEREFSWNLLERLLNDPNFKKIKYDKDRFRIGFKK